MKRRFISITIRKILITNVIIIVLCNLYKGYVTLYIIHWYHHDHYQYHQRKQQEQVDIQLQQGQKRSNVSIIARRIIQDQLLQHQSSHKKSNYTINTYNEPFPRWDGPIPIQSIYDAVRTTLSGKLLQHNLAHRVYIINEKYQLLQANVPSLSQQQQQQVQQDTAAMPYYNQTLYHRPGITESLDPNIPFTFYKRARIMETHTLQVLKHVQQLKQQQNHQQQGPYPYPYLDSIIRHGGGFVFIMNYGDSSICITNSTFQQDDNDSNNKVLFVPIFTLSGPIQCKYTFPLPTYESIRQVDYNPDWKLLVPYYHYVYPRMKQHRQVVWRGTPTGYMNPYINERVQLCYYANQYPTLFNVKMMKKRTWDTTSQQYNNVSWMEHTNYIFNESYILGNQIPMIEFQKYRAILDIDGNSWSSRFSTLLCYTSVILKVQPENVDYFYNEQVQPWVHYIPIHSNLSNLYDMAMYAISDDIYINEIIHNANQWCMEHVNHKSLIHDTAKIWDRYAYHLLMQPNTTTTKPLADFSYTQYIDNQKLYALSLQYNKYWYHKQQLLIHDYNFTFVDAQRKIFTKIMYKLLIQNGLCIGEWIICDLVVIIIIVLYHIHGNSMRSTNKQRNDNN